MYLTKFSLLYFSLILNVFFSMAMGAIVYWWTPQVNGFAGREGLLAGAGAADPEKPLPLPGPDTAGAQIEKTGSDAPVAGSFHWEQVQTEDRRAYVANLKAIGIPVQEIVMLVIADMQNTGELTLKTRAEDADAYWKSSTNHGTSEAKLKLEHLPADLAPLLREPLGEDYIGAVENAKSWWRERVSLAERAERAYGFLSPDKQREAIALDEDFQLLYTLLHQRDYMMPEDREESERLATEKRAELEALLTPEELQSYDLRNSKTARQLRNQLHGVDVTEEEFHKMYALHDAYTSNKSNYEGFDRQARDQLQEEYKRILGEERHRRYKFSRNEGMFPYLVQMIDRLELPRERAYEITELKECYRSLSSVKQGSKSFGLWRGGISRSRGMNVRHR